MCGINVTLPCGSASADFLVNFFLIGIAGVNIRFNMSKSHTVFYKDDCLGF